MRSYKIYDNIEPHQIWREEISKSNYLPKFLSAYAFLFIINVPHKQKCDRVTYQKIKNTILRNALNQITFFKVVAIFYLFAYVV